jgi:hypothetical protein
MKLAYKVSLVLLLTILALFLLKPHLELFEKQIKKGDRYKYLPSAKYINLISLGHTEAVASGLWVMGLINMVEGILDREDISWFSNICNLVTTLDPNFSTVYFFAGGMEVDSKDSSDIEVLQRAVNMYPEDFRHSVYLALKYINKHENYLKAAEVMRPFSTVDTVPPHIQNMSRTFELKTKPSRLRLGMYLEDLVNPTFRYYKSRIQKNISELINPSNDLQVGRIIDTTFVQLDNNQIELDSAFQRLIYFLESHNKADSELAMP